MSSAEMIYLDYAATTPIDPRVVDKMLQYMGPDALFANPASRSHMPGWQAEAAVEHARKQVASLLSADTREVVWTSGATEANNLAIKGAALALAGNGRHIVTSRLEHKAVIDCFVWLEQQGFEVSWLEPDSGRAVITPEQLASVLRPDTILVSLMHVNNETGVVNPVREIGDLLEDKGICFHIDAAQSAGKLPIDTRVLKANLISVCAHKIYGPKGVGALYVRRSNTFALSPQMHGGGHERGMRSGTLATHQIAGMGEAFDLAGKDMEREQLLLAEKRALFLEQLGGEDYLLNSNGEECVPGIVNLAFPGKDGQLLLTALPNLCVSSGSACTSATMSPSHVLKALGLDDVLALSALRFSFGRFTTKEQATEAGRQLAQVLQRLDA